MADGPGIPTPNNALVARITGTAIPPMAGAQSQSSGVTPAQYGSSLPASQGGGYVGTPSTVTPAANGYTPALSAKFNTPASSSQSSMSAPAVVTSQAAEDHYNNVGTQLNSANNDSSAQTASLSSTAPVSTPGGDVNNSSNPKSNAPVENTEPDVNTQISTILSNLDSNLNEIQNNSSNATTTDENGNPVRISDALNQNTVDETAAARDVTTKLAAIASGTYPLTAAEQQLLSSTTSSFSQAIQAQQKANLSLVGGMTATMARLGLETSAPTEAMGAIFGAISEGQSRVADIDGKMALALSKLTTGFQTQDYKMVQDQWAVASKAFSDRTAALEKMQTAVQDAAKQQQTDLIDMAKTQITAIGDSAKLSFQEKDAALKNILGNATLDEKTRHDLQMEIKANTVNKTAAERSAAALANFSSAFVPGAKMADGTPTIDDNGYINPAAWKAAINDAPSEGLSRAEFIKNFGSQVFVDDKGAIAREYGLTPVEQKTILGILP